MTLADTSHRQRAPACFRQRADARRRALVLIARENFVTEDQGIAAFRPPGDLFEILGCNDAARRIGRRVDYQQTRSPHGLGQLIEAEAQTAVVNPGGKPAHAGPPRTQGQDIKRRRRRQDNDTVSWVDERVQGDAHGTGGAMRHQDLVAWANCKLMIGAKHLGDGRA